MDDEHTAAACTAQEDRPPSAPNIQGWNPQQVTTPPQYLGRKTLPIKRGDAEPLTREDLQYDLLYYIFADRTVAFVDFLAPGKPLVNFCDLYVNALYNSSKCSKVLKDKMVETPAFAIEFAKISLLTNVGRINTTMAFFPEMKTALRSYHPRAGQIPPTSVVNLIFVLANSNNSQQIAHSHFDPPVEFLDLFLPVNLSSASRAKAFLWLIPGKVPRLRHLTGEEMARENVDPSEESMHDYGQSRRSRPPRYPGSTSGGSRGSSLSRSDYPVPSHVVSRRRDNPSGAAVSETPYSKYRPDEPSGSSPNQERSMFEHAWHIAATTDPLNDSDEEQDEHVRLDYNRRLRVLSRLRGKDPTPEPETEPVPPSTSMQPSQQFNAQNPPPSGADSGTGRLSQVQSWR
ncbi:uncharacterized protein B0H18DRAFT_971086 [Fomitopsis serialis]|uniref:uncharacterized protein n=1 Tax=Fomitopsis serialis TaxID=139415 RepID=UPI0020073A6C|nr:uncharacterized protein B0H18DRAFT_971086 [Neoantrodia serialis]KAH9937534.1 hypothetical protein B0H18DRAFT_971086 [Neoantrodia serialis]